MSKKRIDELDIIKGIGILIIMVFHLLYRTRNGAADYLIRMLVWSVIPIYFTLAGYSFTPGKRTVLQSYLHRAGHILLPAIITELVLISVGGVYCVFAHGYSAGDWIHDAAVTALRPEWCVNISEEWGNGGVLYNNLSPAWFIWTMAWTELVFYPLAAWCCGGNSRCRRLIAVIALTAIEIPLYIFVSPVSWELQLVPLFTVFMLVGAKIRDMKLIEREWKLSPVITALIAVICFAAVLGLFLLGGDESYYRGQIGTVGGFDVILTVLQLPISSIGFYALAKLILKLKWLSRGMIWIGRHTLMFLLCHDFFGMIAADAMHTYIKPGPMWYVENGGLTLTPEIFLKSLAGVAVSVICCTLVCLAKDKTGEYFRKTKEQV
ncbi:MAG: acyltransferase [Ruminiclostridium sp.]|nr:acyltransferase [Ruminiclostridium sp.]